MLRELLARIAAGQVSIDEAVRELRDLPYRDLGDTLLDRHRALRTGIPEVVLAEHKTPGQVAQIVSEMAARDGWVLVTRLSPEKFEAVRPHVPGGTYDPTSRTFRIVPAGRPRAGRGRILVLCAGTSDVPVAEEAAVTAEVLGHEVDRAYDVGVAGLHRLLDRRALIDGARVLIVVAGMDAALPSVVGGLTALPVVAVPTSVGYGSSLGGLAALLSMLNACSAGITVVNIDNGFGAAVAAARINRL